MDYILILASLLFTTTGQLLQKHSADNAVSRPQAKPFFQQIFLQSETWWAILSLTIGALLWLLVLYRMEVSKAFPFLSLGVVIVLLMSRHYLHEVIHLQRWLGVALICTGIVIIALA